MKQLGIRAVLVLAVLALGGCGGREVVVDTQELPPEQQAEVDEFLRSQLEQQEALMKRMSDLTQAQTAAPGR